MVIWSGSRPTGRALVGFFGALDHAKPGSDLHVRVRWPGWSGFSLEERQLTAVAGVPDGGHRACWASRG